jgi:hypothetical protein
MNTHRTLSQETTPSLLLALLLLASVGIGRADDEYRRRGITKFKTPNL